MGEYPSDPVFFRWVLERLEQGKLVAMIEITKKAGSAPRGPGTKMFIDEDGNVIGTIGGGDFERKVIEEAKRVLETRKPGERRVALFRESLYEEVIATEQLCGGVVNVFIDVLKPVQRLVIIGAGHVARPLAKLGKMLNYRVIVVDNFPQYANKEKIPDADEIYASSNILTELDRIKINKNDFVVIVHGDGNLEAEVLKKIFKEGIIPRYLGLLAGRGKLGYILKSLISSGIDPGIIK
ncbi:MAG: XdhC family protein, partial [Fervidicoccaceae archaeon]